MFLLQLDDSNILLTKEDELVARKTVLGIIANRKTELDICLSEHKKDFDEHGHHVKEDLVAIKVKEELVTLRDLASAHHKIIQSTLSSIQTINDDHQRNWDSLRHSFLVVSSMLALCFVCDSFPLQRRHSLTHCALLPLT